MTFRMIGQQVLFSRPSGYAVVDTTRTTTLKVEEIIDDNVPADLPFVWVSDYSALTGITMAARKLFAATVSGWPRLGGMVIFGFSPVILAAIRIAVRLKLVPFPVLTVSSYREAIETATSVLNSLKSDQKGASHGPEVMTDPSWNLEMDGYSIRFEVVNSSIVHSVQKGRITEAHLDPIFELRDEVMRSAGLQGKRFSILAGMENVERSDHAGRLGYVRRMSRWYRDNPFDIEVFYGLNPLMRTVINISARLAPFRVHVSKSYEEGLAFISDFVRDSQSDGTGSDSSSGRSSCSTGELPQRKIEELLKVLGAISWDTDEDLKLDQIDSSDPLALVYDAVSLVKTEIDDLLAQQARDAAERRQLQERLARSEKMEALGLLAGGVAHDLNNILSGIVSYPELILMDRTLSPETRRAIVTVKNSGDQAAAVVKDLMAISRGAATKTDPVSLNAVVSEYLRSPDFAAMTAECPGIRIESFLTERSTVVPCSSVNLRKIVANLVANAIESTESSPNGGCIRVETFFKHIEEAETSNSQGLSNGDYVVLRVADNGVGISEKHRDKIFEPFFSKKIMGRSGTGLGLTVVWNIVQSHNGSIDLVSGDEGTRFDIFLPASDRPIADVAPRTPLKRLQGKGQSVLVVDDVAVQREIASAMLIQLGYQVETVSSGEAALDRLVKEPFDILLLDMLMEPGINGLETYRRILDFCPGQKAVIASGFSQDDDVRRALELGAGAFITKPYSIEEIGVAIGEVL